MKASAVLSVGCLLVFSASVSFGAKKNVEQPVAINLGETAASENGDIAKVIGRGVGINETEALKDAYRDAVERAVGLFVDAETVVKNDEVLKDQILTQSNAYVSHYDRLDIQKISGGLIQVRIVAFVKKRPLTTKLRDVMPAQTIQLGAVALQDAHAEVSSSEKRDGDAARLLENALKGQDPCLMLVKASLDPQSQHVYTKGKWNTRICGNELPSNKVVLRYLMKARIDEDRYFKEFVPRLRQVLEQISLESPKQIRFSSVEEEDYEIKAYGDYLALDMQSQRARDFGENGLNAVFPRYGIMRWLKGGGLLFAGDHNNFPSTKQHTLGCESINLNSFQSGAMFRHRTMMLRVGANGLYKDYPFGWCDAFKVTLITEVNAQRTIWKGVTYTIDEASANKLGSWLCNDVGSFGECSAGNHLEIDKEHSVVYNVVFLDGAGNELFVGTWPIHRLHLTNVDFGLQDVSMAQRKSGRRIGGGNKHTMMWYVCPFVGCCAEEYIQWKDFLIEKDMLPKIKSVKIEVAE